MIVEVESWPSFKEIVITKKQLSLQYGETSEGYSVFAVDGPVIWKTFLKRDYSEFVDFDANYKSTANTKIIQDTSVTQYDPETGGLKMTSKFAPDGWLQRLHEVEFTTSTVGGAIHDKDYTNADYGWSSIKFYEGDHGSETEITGANLTDQAYLDANCSRTDFIWMPDVDYMILSGTVAHVETPNQDIYMWGLFIDLDDAYGGPQVEVLGGGMNMRFIDPRDKVGLRGVSGSIVYYESVNGVTLPAGSGTNRIRFIFRHPDGLKHRFQILFEIFRS